MPRDKQRDSYEEGSFPAGNGGRVRVPIHRNPDGSDKSIDPIGDIYSGMLKRGARQDGRFCPQYDNLDEVEDG
jgi:hypothetical protein